MPYFTMPDGRQIHYRGKTGLTTEQYQALVRIVETLDAEIATEHKEGRMAKTNEAGPEVGSGTIYTFGYGNSDVLELRQYVEALAATIVDVRLVPWAARPEWRGESLKATFGPQYGQVRALGNPNYRNGGPLALDDAPRGLARVRPVWERGPIILLCGCATHLGCHRTLAADYLGHALGAPVVHLPGRFSTWQPGAVCKSCAAPIVWARHRLSNKAAPLDAVPSATGTLVLEPNGNYYVLPEAERAGRTDLYTSHYARCPQAGQWHAPTGAGKESV